MRRLIVAMAALAAVLATARLGVWQLDRAAQKTQAQARLDARAALPALRGADLATDAQAAAAQHQRAVQLSGRWLATRTVFLDNRQLGDSRPGFFVVTPLQLADGSAVLVQRGWAPRDAAERTRLPALDTPAGEVTLDGRIAPPPARLFEFAEGASGAIRQNLDLGAFAREIGVVLRPLSVVQTSPSPDGLRRDWPALALGVHKHYGYAFQWFALAALIAALYVWYQLIKPRLRAA
jgi:surfeit locus 1 family protein